MSATETLNSFQEDINTSAEIFSEIKEQYDSSGTISKSSLSYLIAMYPACLNVMTSANKYVSVLEKQNVQLARELASLKGESEQ